MYIPRSVVVELKNKYPKAAHEETGNSYKVKEAGTGDVLVAIASNGVGGYCDAQKKFQAKYPLDLSPLPGNARRNIVDENDNVIPNPDFDEEVFNQLIEEHPESCIPSVADLRKKGHGFSCKVSGDHKHHGHAVYTSDQEAKAEASDTEYAEFLAFKKARAKAAAEAEEEEEEIEVDDDGDEATPPVKKKVKKKKKTK